MNLIINFYMKFKILKINYIYPSSKACILFVLKWLEGGVTEDVIRNLKILMQSIFSSPIISYIIGLFSSNNFIGFWWFSSKFFILLNFSSPSLFFKKSENKIVLLGLLGALLGLNIVCAKLNF